MYLVANAVKITNDMIALPTCTDLDPAVPVNIEKVKMLFIL